MAAKSTYWELLRRPEWQEKRLRIMDRAGFKCEDCGTNETTLNVHHKYYTKGAKPWEYPDEALACLCEDCHEEWHYQDDVFKETLARLPLHSKPVVHGFVQGLLLQKDALSNPDASGLMPGPDEFDGFIMAYGINSYPEVWGYLLKRNEGGLIKHSILMRLYELDRMGTLYKTLADDAATPEGR